MIKSRAAVDTTGGFDNAISSPPDQFKKYLKSFIHDKNVTDAWLGDGNWARGNNGIVWFRIEYQVKEVKRLMRRS